MQRIETELIGARHVETTLTGIAHRFNHPTPAFHEAFAVLEAGELPRFAGGQLIRTGRLMASLTQPYANDAIREAHGDTGTFGTSVPYARPAASRAGTHVLTLGRPQAREIAALTIQYVVKGT